MFIFIAFRSGMFRSRESRFGGGFRRGGGGAGGTKRPGGSYSNGGPPSNKHFKFGLFIKYVLFAFFACSSKIGGGGLLLNYTQIQ